MLPHACALHATSSALLCTRTPTQQRRLGEQGGLLGKVACRRTHAVKLRTVRVRAEVEKDGGKAETEKTADPLTAMTGWGMDPNETTALPQNFCLIESPDTVKDFAEMDVEEITSNLETRRTRIFLLMEEVRRLKIQQRMKVEADTRLSTLEQQFNSEYPSALPLLPPLTDETMDTYTYLFWLSISAIILFGGIIAPTLEVKLGLGGQTYAEFIQFLGLPSQISQVDPFVASFTGGAVGVISSLMLIEMNNVKTQALKRCGYCKGEGYLECGSCSGSGLINPSKATNNGGGRMVCTPCSTTGKVMCTSCLCTGMALATEHDPRIDPFD
jgi:hypothetical protein